MALAVAAASALTLVRPAELRVAPAWALPAVEAVLLVVLVLRDPGRIDRRSRALRSVSIGAVGILVADALAATGHLVVVLVHGGQATDSADALLMAGAVVWISNIIAFALLYWELDSGGAAARAHHSRSHVDFAFPQHMDPDLAPADWFPRFVDYLYLGFTNATAFSPTDAMPIAPWAKLAMMVQSVISLAILGLVIARAVNVFA